MNKLNIAIAGFHHETNSFAGKKATLNDFIAADGWPALSVGDEIFKNMVDKNIPMSGFLNQADKYRDSWNLHPLVWCNAPPASLVEDLAFEKISELLIEPLKSIKNLDAIYLDLHGAMITESYEDGEGELLRRIRAIVGMEIPIIVSLDLHANVTNDMFELSDMMVGFRTYPHIDMADTGIKAAKLLNTILKAKTKPAKAFAKTDFLIPITCQYTGMSPASDIYNYCDELEKNNKVVSITFTFGFPPADIRECGPALLVYASDKTTAYEVLDNFAKFVNAKESKFDSPSYKPDQAISVAVESYNGKPIILADTCDNPGAGAESNSVDILKLLVERKVKNAVVASICDPDIADIAHNAGVGAKITFSLNGFSDSFYVRKLSEGKFKATGPMYKGNMMDLGKMALLELDGVFVIVISRKVQAADRAIFKEVGIDPEKQKILVLKSSVHFRADFEKIAGDVLIVDASGPNVDDPEKFNYQHLRNGIKLRPNGRVKGEKLA